ncbi:hypothetical protein [uncultured Demequina sp.]|uniref:hypothetical protein n=1 Tax=uncultured Demequina sp. TaxID=693499 RepID=UPI0025F9EEC1|nr:hypothetical protein [uncultured Demequina sp.]
MTDARPKPLVGALLGLLLGLVVVALLWITGVLPPDRLPLFGIVALSIFVVGWILTQRMSLVRAKFIIVVIISATLGGVALTGIPEFMGGGSLSDGCHLDASSSLEPAQIGPEDTAAMNPFDVTTTDTISWNSSSDAVLTDWNAGLYVVVGGFDIPLWSGEHENSGEAQEWAGDEAVEPHIDSVQNRTGIVVTGTYHVHGSLTADGGDCDMQAYVRVAPASAFDGILLAALWALLVVIIIVIIIVAVGVRRSIKAADAALAMVGTSAIAGETSTAEPAGAGAAAGAAAAGAAAAGAAADTSSEDEAAGDAPASTDGISSYAEYRQADEDARDKALGEQASDGSFDQDNWRSIDDSRGLGDLLDTPDAEGTDDEAAAADDDQAGPDQPRGPGGGI